MIEKITTKGFMGSDIDESIGQKTIYTGENTAGKTKRSKAIILTILGFIPSPGKTIKIASDILNTLGNGQEMSTAITCGGEVFERIFKRGKKGSVSQKFKRNGKTRTKGAFMVELVKAGDPRVVDLDSFLSLSDNGKIDSLFELYPPDGDLSTLDSDIDKSKAECSRLNELKGESDSVIVALNKSKGEIELPSGSLAETRQAIETLTQDIKKAQKSLKDIEIEEAKTAAILKEKEDAKIEAERVAAIDAKKEREETQAKLDETMKGNTVPWGTNPDPKHGVEQKPFKAKDPENQRIHDFTNGKDVSKYDNNLNTNKLPEDKYPRFFKIYDENNDPADSIQKIIDTMADAGCSMCAGLMVARVELRKYK